MVCGLVGFVAVAARADDKPKNSIADVMKKAHKEGLLKKVTGGKADDAEKKELLALYEDLAKNKPPKGDEEGWKKKTEAIVKAAKEVSGGDAKAVKALGKATNCKACHDAHRG
jgi:hypothetical protein